MSVWSIGDLITTCISPHGRNRGVGERLGRGESLDAIVGSMDAVAEGVNTTLSVQPFPTDDDLRPLDPSGAVAHENVHVIGSALAGMHYLAERCGDGVALASAHRVAAALATGRIAA